MPESRLSALARPQGPDPLASKSQPLAPGEVRTGALLPGQLALFHVDVPPGAEQLEAQLRKGSGDPLLMLRHGAPPRVPRRAHIVADFWDQRAFEHDSVEHRVAVDAPSGLLAPGTWYIGVSNYSFHKRETSHYTLTLALSGPPAPASPARGGTRAQARALSPAPSPAPPVAATGPRGGGSGSAPSLDALYSVGRARAPSGCGAAAGSEAASRSPQPSTPRKALGSAPAASARGLAAELAAARAELAAAAVEARGAALARILGSCRQLALSRALVAWAAGAAAPVRPRSATGADAAATLVATRAALARREAELARAHEHVGALCDRNEALSLQLERALGSLARLEARAADAAGAAVSSDGAGRGSGPLAPAQAGEAERAVVERELHALDQMTLRLEHAMRGRLGDDYAGSSRHRPRGAQCSPGFL